MEQEQSMKKPWMMFAGICAIVMGIVLICVIMGSYSSLLRAKDRIDQGKSLLILECETRAGMFQALTAKAGETMDPGMLDPILENEKQAARVLAQMKEIQIHPDLVQDFNASQGRLSQDIFQVILQVNKGSAGGSSESVPDRVNALETHQEVLRLAALRYNKAVRYFIERKSVFPGFLVAKWFHLDELSFPEVDPGVFSALKTVPDQKE